MTHKKIFVNCPGANGFSPNNVSFTAANSEIVVNNKINITGGSPQLVIRDPRKLFVRGDGGTGISVGSANGFQINKGGFPTATPATTAAETQKKLEFVIMNGTLGASGNGGIRMCQTMLYLAGGIGLPDGHGRRPGHERSNGTLSITGGGGASTGPPPTSSSTPRPSPS